MPESGRLFGMVTSNPDKVDEARIVLREIYADANVLQVFPLVDEKAFSMRAGHDHLRPLQIALLKAVNDRNASIEGMPGDKNSDARIDAYFWWLVHGFRGQLGNIAFYNDVVTVVNGRPREQPRNHKDMFKMANAQSGQIVDRWCGLTGMRLDGSFPVETVGIRVTSVLNSFTDEELRQHFLKTGGFETHRRTAGVLSMVRDRNMFDQAQGLNVEFIPNVKNPKKTENLIHISDWSILTDQTVGMIKDGMFKKAYWELLQRLESD